LVNYLRYCAHARPQGVWKNNSYIDGVAGVANACRDADWVTFDVGSGTYRFSLTVDGNVIKSSSITPTVKKENVGSGDFR
jgi:hypothetical protein